MIQLAPLGNLGRVAGLPADLDVPRVHFRLSRYRSTTASRGQDVPGGGQVLEAHHGRHCGRTVGNQAGTSALSSQYFYLRNNLLAVTTVGLLSLEQLYVVWLPLQGDFSLIDQVWNYCSLLGGGGCFKYTQFRTNVVDITNYVFLLFVRSG